MLFSRSILDAADRHRTLVEIDRRLQKLESETRAEPDSKAVPDVTLPASVSGSHSFQCHCERLTPYHLLPQDQFQDQQG
jgi:hypothetical protein